jgi:hypothetical protein
MNEQSVRERLKAALETLLIRDSHLLEIGVHERALMARVAVYLAPLFPEYSVDVEYNRHGIEVKRAEIPEECATKTDRAGKAIIIPDLIVHQRDNDNENLLVLEAKKSANRKGQECDRLRLEAMKRELQYRFAALVKFRVLRRPVEAPIVEWI